MTQNTLHKKIFEIKKEVGKISKDSTNPFFKSKYFDINQLLEHLEPIFTKHNVLCLQPILNGSVVTRLVDVESNEFVESSISLPELSDAQKIGSCITYYRRYSLQSLLGLQAEDDDANRATGNTTKTNKPATNQAKFLKVDKWLSPAEFEETKKYDKDTIRRLLVKYNGEKFTDGKVYSMKKEYRTELEKLI